MIPDHLSFRRLKTVVSIERVLADAGLLNRFHTVGNKLMGPCPVHRGDNPRAFVVNRSRNLWHCFTRCARGGDTVDLVRALTGKSYAETANYLANLANRPAPDPHHPPQPTRARPFRPFLRRLPLDPAAPFLSGKGILPETAALFEAGAYYGPGFLHQCIGVRLHDLRGRPIGYAGRQLQPRQAAARGKWKLPPLIPVSRTLYNFHRIRQANHQRLVIVECPWGVMRLHQIGWPAVALMGTHISAVQRRILAQMPRIIIMMDGDNAGRAATKNSKQMLQLNSAIQSIQLPDHCDPDDLTDSELLAALHSLLP